MADASIIVLSLKSSSHQRGLEWDDPKTSDMLPSVRGCDMLSFRETEHVTASSTLSMGYHLPVYCVQKANSDSAMQVPSRTFYAAANESNTVLYLGRRSTIGGVQPWQPGIECRPRNSSLGVDSSSKWIPAVLRLRKVAGAWVHKGQPRA